MRHDSSERTTWTSRPGHRLVRPRPLIAAYRKAARPEGTITHVNGLVGDAAVSVSIDGQVGTYTFKLGDVEILP
jgi:hypothetical protein